MLTALILSLLPMDVYLRPDVDAAMGREAAVHGTVRRVPISKGKGTWEGTGVVLDDGTVVYVTYRDPPDGWAALVGRYVRVVGVLTTSSSDTAQSLVAPHLTQSRRPELATRALSRLVGKRVSLVGKAEDAKSGAVLMVDGAPIYVRPLEAWPSAARTKDVVVTGRLESEKLIPSPKVDAQGAISQGAEGDQWVLEEASWSLR
jgi:hypothetical protein